MQKGMRATLMPHQSDPQDFLLSGKNKVENSVYGKQFSSDKRGNVNEVLAYS